MAKIQTPVEHYNGKVGDVTFVDGVGETDDPAHLAYFESAGYTIDGDTDTPEGEGKPVSDLTVAELRVLAQQKGITIPSDAKKADIVKLLDSKDVADPGSQPAPLVGDEVVNVQAGDGGETGAAEGAVFGGTPASSDVDNKDAQGEVVA